jgi:hypothetical protein
LTLYLAITCLITSPSEADLPSLPALLKSMDDKVKDSVKTGALLTLGLIRGPVADPQTEEALVFGVAETREGKATSSVVSKGRASGDLDCAEVS